MRSGIACRVHVTTIESERDMRSTQFVPGNLTQPEFLKIHKNRKRSSKSSQGEGAAKVLEEENSSMLAPRMEAKGKGEQKVYRTFESGSAVQKVAHPFLLRRE